MIHSAVTFVENMYWIDVSTIIIFVVLGYILILTRTKKIVERNKKYNKELYEMRSEIYTEYEKNFFL